MRRRNMAVAILALVALAVATRVLADGTIRLIIDGRPLKPDIAIRIEDGRVVAPVRHVAEALGAKVEWDAQNRAVSIHSHRPSLAEQRIGLLEEALSPATPRDAVEKWAKGVMARNGALQYAVLSPELREANLSLYEGARWVSGTSSPWVESFEIVGEREIPGEAWEYEVVFDTATSTGPAGASVARVSVRRAENGPRLSRRLSDERWHVVEIAVGPGIDHQLRGVAKNLMEAKYGLHYRLLEIDVSLISRTICDSQVSAELLASVVTVPDCDTPSDWPPQKGRIMFLEEHREALSEGQIRAAEMEIEFWNREMQMYIDEPSEANEILKIMVGLDGCGGLDEETMKLYYQDPMGKYVPVSIEDWLDLGSTEELVERGYELMRRLVAGED